MRGNIRFYLLSLVIVFAVQVVSVNAGALDYAGPIDTSYPGSGEVTSGVSGVVYKIRDMILEYFTPMSGVVEEVVDGKIRVGLGDGADVKKGMRFSVFREGRPFYHSVTNELIGYAEEPVGKVAVNAAGPVDGLYDCVIITGDIRVGDKVRITSSRIRLAFFQYRKSDWADSEALYGALKDSGRFEILETYASDYDPDTLSGLAKGLGAEAFLVFSSPDEGRGKSIRVRLYWVDDGGLFGDIREAADRNAMDIFELNEEFISSVITESGRGGVYDLPGGGLIAMGDVDGNGIRELVVSDGSSIRVYSLKDEPREIWFIKGRSRERHLSIDILDVNGNGMAEIFVTSMIERGDSQRISSFVVEYDPAEGYRRIESGMPYFLRVSGNSLLMQKFDRYRIFSASVYEGQWQGGHYQTGRLLRLPVGLNIYGFTFVDWGKDGHPILLTFDDRGYLYLYDEDLNMKWKSDKSYGVFAFSFELDTGSMDGLESRWFVRGRLISVETDTGQKVVLLNRNPVATFMPGLGSGKAEVSSLSWNDGRMNEKVIVSELPGNITDYWVEGGRIFLIARGNFFTFLKNATSGEFIKGSKLYYYNLP